MTDMHLDGNVLAGPLTEVFAGDVTSAVAVCAACGRASEIATLQVYAGGPGFVARCPGCESVVLRYAQTPYGRWLDLHGAAALHFGGPFAL